MLEREGMKPIEFKQANKHLRKPSDMTAEQCKPLVILNVDNLCISLWKASIIERVRFLLIGKLWLIVRSGNTQPPVKITIDKPFVEGEK